MKYCSKCGNELLDEAVICPKCGCPVEGSTNKADSTTKILKANKHSKITSAIILNIVAFVLSLVACGVFWMLGYSTVKEAPAMPIGNDGKITYDIFGNIQDIKTAGDLEEEYQEELEAWENETAEMRSDNQKLMVAIGAWGGLSIVVLVLGILAAKKAIQGQKKLTVAYMITAVVAPVCALLIRPDFVVAFVCGIGLIMLVPPILNMIAGGKLLQAASINE